MGEFPHPQRRDHHEYGIYNCNRYIVPWCRGPYCRIAVVLQCKCKHQVCRRAIYILSCFAQSKLYNLWHKFWQSTNIYLCYDLKYILFNNTETITVKWKIKLENKDTRRFFFCYDCNLLFFVLITKQNPIVLVHNRI